MSDPTRQEIRWVVDVRLHRVVMDRHRVQSSESPCAEVVSLNDYNEATRMYNALADLLHRIQKEDDT